MANDEGQRSPWPVFIDVPDGWTVVHPEGPDLCRPSSLVDARRSST
ncbi:MbtH family NRPS accessory protein [Nonomuraea sp. NPDC049129]